MATPWKGETERGEKSAELWNAVSVVEIAVGVTARVPIAGVFLVSLSSLLTVSSLPHGMTLCEKNETPTATKFLHTD